MQILEDGMSFVLLLCQIEHGVVTSVEKRRDQRSSSRPSHAFQIDLRYPGVDLLHQNAHHRKGADGGHQVAWVLSIHRAIRLNERIGARKRRVLLVGKYLQSPPSALITELLCQGVRSNCSNRLFRLKDKLHDRVRLVFIGLNIVDFRCLIISLGSRNPKDSGGRGKGFR